MITKLAMYCFNGICCIDDPANILWVLEILAELFPVVTPGLDDN